MNRQAPANAESSTDVSTEAIGSDVPRGTLALLGTALAWLLSLPIHAYRLCLSPLLPAACRHEPSCSRYALEALAVHGPLRGLLLAVGRILRCNPWGTYGPDPVPPRAPSNRRRKPAVISS